MFFCHKPILFVCNPLELPYLLKKAPRHLFAFSRHKAVLFRGRRLFEGGAYLNIVPDKYTFSIFLFNGTLSIS